MERGGRRTQRVEDGGGNRGGAGKGKGVDQRLCEYFEEEDKKTLRILAPILRKK